MARDDHDLDLRHHVLQEARRDIQEVHRAVSDAHARLELSKRLLQTYLANANYGQTRPSAAAPPEGGDLQLLRK